jgi:uncharacterized protein GlcG (DUF336 family)
VTSLDLPTAQAIIADALAHARAHKFQPLVVVVLDARGALKALAAEDNTSVGRAQIAIGKASGAIGLGIGSRSLGKRARDVPHFIAAVGPLMRDGLVPVPGGVLIRDGHGQIVGAVGVSGDTSDNDEAAAKAGIAKVGLTADPGAD